MPSGVYVVPSARDCQIVRNQTSPPPGHSPGDNVKHPPCQARVIRMLTEQHGLIAPVPADWKLKVQAERWCRKKLQVAATLTFSNHAYLAQPAVDCVHLGTQEHAEAGKYSDGRRVALGMSRSRQFALQCPSKTPWLALIRSRSAVPPHRSRAWQFCLYCHGRTPCSPSTA